MKKIKPIIEFILALLNFLFHFKHEPDEPGIDRMFYRMAWLKLILPLLRRWAKKGMQLYLKLTVKVRIRL